MPASQTPTNRSLLLPYLLPYLAYVLPGYLLGDVDERVALYAVRTLACGAALWWGRRHYLLRVRSERVVGSLALGALAGLFGLALWTGLLWPFVSVAGEPWTGTGWTARLLVAGTLPPVFEELLMRGWLLGVAVQWDRARRRGAPSPLQQALDHESITTLEPGAWTATALLVSSVVFALGHGLAEIPAALVYGLLMCGLWIVRKDLLSCITAHAVTNIALAFYVRASGHWGFW